MSMDIRWRQRFNNFNRAMKQLDSAMEIMNKRELSALEEQGLIQSFEYSHELAWNVLKDYLEEYGGLTGLIGSRDTTREAFKSGLIDNGEVWMEMIKSRNLSSHTYNEKIAKQLILAIPLYHKEFVVLQAKMDTLLKIED